MKKVIVSLIIFIVILAISNVYAATPTLEQIAEAFNNHSDIKEMAEMGSIWNATVDGDKLKITTTTSQDSGTVEYILNGNILSVNFSEEEAFSGLIVSTYVIDSIGTLHGYSEGELLKTINSEEGLKYTLEDEGYSIKQETSGNCDIKIDISKKIPLIDFSNTYIEVDDLKDLKSYINGDGSAQLSAGNILFHKDGYDGENTVIIAEENELTENAYKSLLSVIEVMFDSNEAVEYFKTNYAGFSVGNKEFTGIKVEINPTKTEWESSIVDTKDKFVRVTINKENVVNAMNNSKKTQEQEGNTVGNEIIPTIQNKTKNTVANETIPTNQNKTANIDKIPNTGREVNLILTVAYITIVLCGCGLLVALVKSKEV